MNLPAQLRRWQGERTAAQAAGALGINRRTYEDWLQGRRAPRGLALAYLKNLLAADWIPLQSHQAGDVVIYKGKLMRILSNSRSTPLETRNPKRK